MMINALGKLILVAKVIQNFPTAVLDRLGFKKGIVVYKLRKNNVSFYARAGTEDLSEIAVIGGEKEYDVSKIILPKNPVIVDLGAHIGSFSIPLAKKLKNKCKIFAFEPEAENYKLFKKNIRRNRALSIKAFNVAISDYNGKGSLSNMTGNTDSYYLNSNKTQKINCIVKRLPDALKKYQIDKIDLLKMDIEGSEYAVFNDSKSKKFIDTKIRQIYVEFHTREGHSFSELKKITKKNFKILFKTKNVALLKNLQ